MARPAPPTETGPAGPSGPPPPGDTPPGDSAPRPPGRLGLVGWLRWAWRLLTTMRVALILLFLLALAAVPGSFLPQRGVSPSDVAAYYADNPELAALLDTLWLFDVYSAPWFAAIYLLLFTSLVGCVVPRAAKHWRDMRARPPAAPARLDRMPYSASFSTGASPAEVLDRAQEVLRGFRTDRTDGSVAAEKGYLRETGNVVFHIAMLGLLAAVAAGSLFGYRGNILLTEGDGFANTVASYDAYYPGSQVRPGDLQPFSFTLDGFDAAFIDEGPRTGQPVDFTVETSFRTRPEAPEERYTLRVNQPLDVDGARVYLVNHGYAPEFRVTDGNGDVVLDQAVPFIPPQAGAFFGEGVIKVPDARPEQLSFLGAFYPSAEESAEAPGQLGSASPEDANPMVALQPYRGDLGLDSGEPQSVYELPTERLEPLGEQLTLAPGDSVELPDGTGTITFTGYREWAAFQITSDPGRVPALVSAVLITAGLVLTLTVRRRRYWVRAETGPDGRTLVRVGGLTKTENGAAAAEFHDLTTTLRDRLAGGSASRPNGE
ncbi:cytochrome c biogenesis protein ResB [Allonocardiopsis opalescens]|uniref:Cytochrome c biogenesis protein n=1 Tax=Allonocardiopsis opalescens TaxID=1144618 RepID=A0A2T0Q838_9ACTN|nr:cytochrome c biogenesis protein ResB [Allonocardiopsis opalescens]PRX99903.1 cytochrome c biogenesis protein [Allonocardiopsis opalescens]